MGTERIHYFLKLIPPRPDFSISMTEDEKTIMKEHILFWQDLLAKGICIVYGPVFDPKGAYGIGIIEAEDDAIVKFIEKNDPSVKKGLNRFEIFSMKAVTK